MPLSAMELKQKSSDIRISSGNMELDKPSNVQPEEINRIKELSQD